MMHALSAGAIGSGLDHNRERFERLLALAGRYAARGRYDVAAAWVEMAADQAWHGHPGFFADDRLERLLARIGTATTKAFHSRASEGSDAPRRVLHVLTEAYAIGGHTRFVWRWIEADRGRRHCVVLTRHRLPGPLPQRLLSAPQATGGWLRALDWRRFLPVARAGQLRALAAEFDLVAVHAHPFDVVPAIAFAGAGGPPAVVVNHAGFSFWTGRGVADVVACLRPSSRDVAMTRRGIELDRCPPLPIPVNQPDRIVSRSEARARLGLAADAVVLFTVADPFKYLPFEPGRSFVDLVTSVARADRRVQVLAIGPDDQGAWREAREQTGGRVRALGRHPEVALHERAADLYLDPFPVTSPTSFLEAGSHGLPIVSFCPHRHRAAVLCADDFALDDLLVRTESAASFTAEVGRLIEDAAAREALGRVTAEAVMAGHGPEAFAPRLAEVYLRAASMHAAGRSAAGDVGQAGPLDECLVRMQEAAGISLSFKDLAGRHLDAFPHGPREWLRVKARVGSYLARRRPAAIVPAREPSSLAQGQAR